MTYQSLRLQTLESMVAQNLFKHSKHIYIHGIHVLHYQFQAISVCKWFYVYEINIRSPQGQGRLAASLIGCNQDPAECDFRRQ